eukprot:GHVS01028278.1.p1 GENE.GHVS01028278.1~~GHVS01028278.1.p1  ORF type:complete len:184 (-),score=8.96 GHVS01028278.1:268-819(-)
MVWAYRNQRIAKRVFSNWQMDFNDPLILNYFFRRSVNTCFNEPPHYHYWWLTWVSVGVYSAVTFRYFLCSPQTMFRPLEKSRNPLDRWKLDLYSLPYFNHWLRNYASIWTNSLADNEPDWQCHHPWGIRPERGMSHRRFWLFLCTPHRYFIDDPNYEAIMHKNVEKRYEALGYYKCREKQEES